MNQFAFLYVIVALFCFFKLLNIYVEPQAFTTYAIKIGLKSHDNYYIVGSSRAFYFYIPNIIEKQLKGKTIRVVAGHSTPVYHSYIIMKKLLKKKKTEAVFYDITMLTLKSWDFDKTKYWQNASEDLQNRLLANLNYFERIVYCIHYHYPINIKRLISLFNLYRYKCNLKFSKKRLKSMFIANYNRNGEKISREYMPSKGYKDNSIYDSPLEAQKKMAEYEFSNINISQIKQDQIPTEYVRMLVNLLDLAKKKDKKLHFIISPLYNIPTEMPSFYCGYDHMLRIIKDYDSQLIDLNKNITDTDFDITCFYDYYHINHKGAILSSNQLASFIQNPQQKTNANKNP